MDKGVVIRDSLSRGWFHHQFTRLVFAHLLSAQFREAPDTLERLLVQAFSGIGPKVIEDGNKEVASVAEDAENKKMGPREKWHVCARVMS